MNLLSDSCPHSLPYSLSLIFTSSSISNTSIFARMSDFDRHDLNLSPFVIQHTQPPVS